MTVKEAEKTEDVTVVPKEQEKLLDNETLRDLAANPNDPTKFDNLSPEQKEEFHNRFVEGEEEGVPTLEEEQNLQSETGKPAEEAGAQPTTTPEVKTEDLSLEEQERRQKYKELRDNNNTLTQKLKNYESKSKTLQESKLEKPPVLEQDEFDDNAKKQNEWNAKLAQGVNQKIDTELADLNADRAELQQDSMYSKVGMLQSENTELRTEKPIKALNNAFVKFRNELAPGADEEAKNKAVDLFLSNPENRKAKEAEGLLFPFSDKDWDAFGKISEVNSFKQNGNYPDLESAYFMFKKESGYIPDPIKQAAIDATTKIVEQVSNGQNQTTVLSP
ncbi:unnamed protein product, partial [marine sediment metagenome]